MMIGVLSRGTVVRENSEAFGDLLREVLAAVHENEAGRTLTYDFYLADHDEEGNCDAHEAYTDVSALLAHLKSIGPFTLQLSKLLKHLHPAILRSFSPAAARPTEAMVPVDIHHEYLGGI